MHPEAAVLSPVADPRPARQRILVVEDNAISMKMIRLALTGAGYSVLEATDGRTAIELMGTGPPADLVLQDLKLPDMDGVDLLPRLRGLPGMDAVPILALSGFLSKMESARMVQGGFTDYLFKPVEPSQLLLVVEAYLRPMSRAGGQAGAARRILVADDDPVQLKLSRMHLTNAGFEVTTAVDGVEALEMARRLIPAAVVSDVLMPRLDGFRLCMALKQEPRLAEIPVVLTSSAFTEAADAELARKAGADALVVRSPDQKEVLHALLTSLDKPAALRPAILDPDDLPTELYAGRVAKQLEGQANLVTRLTRRLALLQAEIGILSAAAEAINANQPRERVLRNLLQLCLNASGYSRGAIYLEESGRLSLGAEFGFAGPAVHHLVDFFGHADLLLEALEAERPVIVPGPTLSEDRAEDFLGRAGVKSIVFNAIKLGGARLGVYWMGSDRSVPEADVVPFAEAISGQIAQALALTRSFAAAARAEEEYRSIFENAVEGIFEIGREAQVVHANTALARILGYASPAELVVAAPRLAQMFIDPARGAEFEGCLREAKNVAGFEAGLLRHDGVTIWVSISGHAVRDEGGALAHYLGFLEDVTERIRSRERHRQEDARRQQLQIKDQFLSLVSHELRTPVAAIHQFTTILLDGLGAISRRSSATTSRWCCAT